MTRGNSEIILVPVFERAWDGAEDFDGYVDGKILAGALEKLEELANGKKQPSLGDFYYEDPGELADLLGESAEPGSAPPWHEAGKGADAIQGLIVLVKASLKASMSRERPSSALWRI